MLTWDSSKVTLAEIGFLPNRDEMPNIFTKAVLNVYALIYFKDKKFPEQIDGLSIIAYSIGCQFKFASSLPMVQEGHFEWKYNEKGIKNIAKGNC